MNILFILIIVVIAIAIAILFGRSGLEGFAEKPREQYMIPFDSPFNTGFFKIKEKKTEIGVIHNSFEAKFAALLAPGNANCPKVTRNRDAIKQVNSRKLDFAIVLEDVLYDAINSINMFKGMKLENLRHVATLYSGNVNIICPNDLPVSDLSDIIRLNRKLNISVGQKQSQHHICAMKILRYLELEGRINYVYSASEDDIVDLYRKGKVDIVWQVSEHPSTLIKKTSNAVLSHFVNMIALNNGDLYKNTLSETEFYESHESYQKALHDLDDLIPRVYPKLTVQDRNQLYAPTIKSNYVLITHDHTPDRNVSGFLNTIIEYIKKPPVTRLYFLKSITTAGLSHNKLRIEYHPAAAAIYRKMNFTSDDKNSHCTFYADGQCPSKVPDVFTQTVKQRNIDEGVSSFADKFAATNGQAQSD